ncbi:hypothetical protein BDW66DRAFT_63459 [Aspergillus desertorum]
MSISDTNPSKFEHTLLASSSTDNSSSRSVPTAIIVLLPLITGVAMMAGIWCFAVKRGARGKARTFAKEQEQELEQELAQAQQRADSGHARDDGAGGPLIQMQQGPPAVVRPGGGHTGIRNEVEDAPPPYSVAVGSTAPDGQRHV